ncbi:DMT family transporter [Streptomyces hainanensis]|uniref:EamA family transporter n=1 Tax=Streptomyces hainanensis TaxID=402648 RepID=A0A4R4TJN2_9ACTN|nr:DMT family transporter [Streptomyces hainanensis]TDC75984.1 EamA family transporter [Streptomyces hainanensis]
MTDQNSATAPRSIAVPAPEPAVTDRGGIALAALGVVAFSLTFPGTVWGLDGLGPWTLTCGRVVLGAVIAVGWLAVTRAPRPERRHWPSLATVAVGTVVGFPLLTTLALQTSSTSHAAVVVGLLPITTACYATVRTGNRPSRTFWAAALVGAGVVVAFAIQQNGGAPTGADGYLLLALLLCAAAYGEGGRLARELPGWQVMSWGLVASLPFALPGLLVALSAEPADLTARSITGLLWVAAGSQIFGIAVWYRGLARAGIARASQLQLAQPLLTLLWAVLLLDETLTPAAPLAALAVLACIAITQRSRG